MLRDTLVGLIESMQISAGVDPLALTIQKQASDDSPSCLANPRPDRAESSLTENATSPFQAEPAQKLAELAGALCEHCEHCDRFDPITASALGAGTEAERQNPGTLLIFEVKLVS